MASREKTIQMVDLHAQYLRLKKEIDSEVQAVLDNAVFINGPQVKEFTQQLAGYLDSPHVIPCGNGTDALQITLMGLGLKPGDEVIIPAFTYVSAIEVIVLLGMIPVAVDVNPDTFNINTKQIEPSISSRTKAIIVVHLFGQCCDMEPILKVASKYNLFVIEDNAQSTGASYIFPDKTVRKGGTMGHIGTTSFFPTKPLACYGDGGAIITPNAGLAERMYKIANHGQGEKYHHHLVGCNSRLDTLQAAVLKVKLKYMDAFAEARQRIARRYDEAFQDCRLVETPMKSHYSTHVYHQYTLRVNGDKRDALRAYLHGKGIPTMIYYPMPVHEQEAFKGLVRTTQPIREATRLSRSVLSLPIHAEMTVQEQAYIIDTLLRYE
jgi:dTDP-4-amino-4,6-dideoxygalactose transaminase